VLQTIGLRVREGLAHEAEGLAFAFAREVPRSCRAGPLSIAFARRGATFAKVGVWRHRVRERSDAFAKEENLVNLSLCFANARL